MRQTREIIKALQEDFLKFSLPEFWKGYDKDKHNFQELLNQLSKYCDNISLKKKQIVNDIFWDQIKKIGTPIIEDRSDGMSEVYFLFPRSKLADSDEKKGDKKELYLQGDFHGYGSTLKKSQLLIQMDGTEIMYRRNTMPKGALVTYYYVQLEPSHGDKPATHFYGDIAYPPPFFFPVTPKESPKDKPVSKSKEEIDTVSKLFWGDSAFVDECCKFHKSYDQNSGFFCADSKRTVDDLGLPVRLKGDNEFFDRFFATKVKNASLALASKNDKIVDFPENQSELDKCSRSILVFAPEDKKAIDNVVIIYDGRFYQLGNTQERLEKLYGANTAVIYITPEIGVMEEAKENGIQLDATDSLPGMNERMVDLKYQIDNYARFIHEVLLPELVNHGFEIPDDPNKRILVGSSAAGTASMYIGMKYPQWFGKVVVQSPSIANRDKLEEFVNRSQMPPPPDIYLSCGQFECPEHAKNLNLPFAKELEDRLKVKLHINPYGHQIEGWSPDLEIALPALGVIAAPLIEENNIPAISIATVSLTGSITTKAEGVTSQNDPQKVTDQTVFEAASLSKPVFAYIVLKMAERGEINLDTSLIDILKSKFGKENPNTQFGPPFPGIRGHENYKIITPKMLLSHQAGLPNEFISPDFKFVTKAGEGFDYSGEAYRFLMEVIDKIASPKTVEDLSQEEFKKIGMDHSSFIRPDTTDLAIGYHEDGNVDEKQHFFGIHPAGSLHTTAEDYGKFLRTCINDEFVRKEMFTPWVPTLAGKDDEGSVPKGILSQIAWGFGIGLQKNVNGSMTAFHWGDGRGTCKNFAAINLSTNQAVVCLTSSANGPRVFKQVCEPIVGDLSFVSDWLSIRTQLPMSSIKSPSPEEEKDLVQSVLSHAEQDNPILFSKKSRSTGSKFTSDLSVLIKNNPLIDKLDILIRSKEREKIKDDLIQIKGYLAEASNEVKMSEIIDQLDEAGMLKFPEDVRALTKDIAGESLASKRKLSQ